MIKHAVTSGLAFVQSQATSPAYSVRLITCKFCRSPCDTASVQLWTTRGFRQRSCSRCSARFSAADCKCSCGQIWHACPLHCVDPRVDVNVRRKRGLPSSSEHCIRADCSGVSWPLYPHRDAPPAKAGAKFLRTALDRGGAPGPPRLIPQIAPTLAARFPHLVAANTAS